MFITFVLIFKFIITFFLGGKFIILYLLHVLFVLKIKSIFEKKKSTKNAESIFVFFILFL